jgi:DNA topoisomerase-3
VAAVDDAAAIRDGFAQLRTTGDEGLADAAVCRSESDWLVGINGTRAMTAFNSKTGGFHLTTVGRVQTPTLAIVVEREDKIREVQVARLLGSRRPASPAPPANTEGRWFDEKFKGKGDETNTAPTACGTKHAPRRCASPGQVRRQAGTVTEEAKPSHPAVAAALRPHQPAARGQRPLRLLGQDDAVGSRRRCTRSTRC